MFHSIRKLQEDEIGMLFAIINDVYMIKGRQQAKIVENIGNFVICKKRNSYVLNLALKLPKEVVE